MTQEEIRIKCAELEGYRCVKEPECGGFDFHWYNPKGEPINAPLTQLPDYLNDANAALRLCGVMEKRGYRWVIHSCGFNQVEARFVKPDMSEPVRAIADTAPEAICTAALRAEGGGV
jgi:hypothetical protein